MIKYGKWWNNHEEIDIVGINSTENEIIFGECKFYDKKLMDADIFFNLLDKTKSVDWKRANRKEEFILFSITGYTKRLKEIAKEREDLTLA